MPDEVKPAMTAEEWAGVVDDPAWWDDRLQDAAMGTSHDLMTYLEQPYRRHALAALALHGQPFGFTREDVATLRKISQHVFSRGIPATNAYAIPNVESLADRIESLLPPEDTPDAP